MAKAAYKGTVDASGAPSAQTTPDVIAAVDYTDFAAALAILVADGASPTEQHVTDVDDAWTALKVLIDAQPAIVSGNVLVTIDLATVASVSDLHKVFSAIERAALGSGLMRA